LPRSLLSYPTRRSSDLKQRKCALPDIVMQQIGEAQRVTVHCEFAKVVRNIVEHQADAVRHRIMGEAFGPDQAIADVVEFDDQIEDRKSTRLNSSHVKIS